MINDLVLWSGQIISCQLLLDINSCLEGEIIGLETTFHPNVLLDILESLTLHEQFRYCILASMLLWMLGSDRHPELRSYGKCPNISIFFSLSVLKWNFGYQGLNSRNACQNSKQRTKDPFGSALYVQAFLTGNSFQVNLKTISLQT